MVLALEEFLSAFSAAFAAILLPVRAALACRNVASNAMAATVRLTALIVSEGCDANYPPTWLRSWMGKREITSSM